MFTKILLKNLDLDFFFARLLQCMGLQRVRHDWATELNWTEAEDIKKRWQEYTEELYRKDLHEPDHHDGVITHLEPDILECEAKWALKHHYEQS